MPRVMFILSFLLFCLPGVYVSSADFTTMGNMETGISAEPDSIDGHTAGYFDHSLAYHDGKFVLIHSLGYLPSSETSQAQPLADLVGYRLYQAYFTLSLTQELLFTAGKFRLPLTRSVFFAPLDTINPGLDGLDTESPRGGFWGASAGWTVNMDILTGVFVDLSDTLRDSDGGSLPGVGGYVSWFTGNLDILALSVYKPGAYGLSGLAASFQALDTIWYAEAGIQWLTDYRYPSDASFSKTREDIYLLEDVPFTLVAGAQKIFYFTAFSFSFVAEYKFTEAGYRRNEVKNTLSLLAQGIEPEGELPDFGRHHCFVSIGMEMSELLSYRSSLVVNLQDTSLLQLHSLTFLFFTDIDLNASVQLMHGDPDTEFGHTASDYRLDLSAVFHF
ncbi:MAG: hypothetical protein JXB03_11805 [Spirochaetales bacterium]|nr:hypothetical protein [Spirochaetales bacterium]